MASNGISFRAGVISGMGKGKDLGVPTFNLELVSVPEELCEGVYAVMAGEEENMFPGTMHYGPRPTLGFEPSCEVHLLEGIESLGEISKLSVTAVEKLRDVQNFGDAERLKVQLQEDVRRAREILR